MPATEQTWRDTKLLHVVFGISSIVMFLCTLWLLAADHYRPWKDYQRKFQEIENWTLASRANEQETTEYSNTASRLAAAVDRAVIAKPSEELKDQFVEQTKKYQAAGSFETDIADLEAAYKALIDAIGQIKNSSPNDEQLKAEAERIEPYRKDFFDRMDAIVSAVKFVEDDTAGKRKFRLADVNKLKSEYDLGVRDQLSAEAFERIGKELSEAEIDVATLSSEYEAANEQRTALDAIVKELSADEDKAGKQANEHQAAFDQLRRTLAERTAFGRGILEMPIIDAFGGPLRIQQIWLPDLTLNNNFRDVARFDRCTTCHLGIDKTAPGSAVLPGLPPLQDPQVIELAVPAELPDGAGRTTQTLYGFQLSEHGLIDRADVLVEFVWPRSAAAEAGLQRGDVITQIQVGDRNERLVGRSDALRYLVGQPPEGKTLKLTVQRGFVQPFSSHPRLDLFVGSMSPHKLQAMGCTICHDGQGSATDFTWASHTPNSPAEAERWQREHGWFDNHHWIFPMKPTRFAESTCLKCHHQVTELEPSERFPDPPAPKLVEGYKLIEYYGCFGCHEVNGFDGPHRRVGPDIRTEPQYFAAAQQLAYELSEVSASGAGGEGSQNAALESMRALAERVSYHPDNDGLRRRLVQELQREADRGGALKKLLGDFGLTGEGRELANKIKAASNDLESRRQLAEWIDADQRQVSPALKPASHRLVNLIVEPPQLSSGATAILDLLKDVEVPGTMRKVGPSLRYVRSKLGKQTMDSWIKLPQSIRPSSKMPAFFGMFDHFKDSESLVKDTMAREVIEIRAAAHYLYERSQPFEFAAKDARVTEAADAERGKIHFETRGCLACHRHDGTPQGDANHGPNLSNLAKKINTADGKSWLRSWLLQPDRYHRRTKMPVTFLDPEPLLGADGKPLPVEGGSSAEAGEPANRMTDPAADIAEYLLGPDWQPKTDDVPPLSTEQEKMLGQLALEYLKTAFAEKRAEEYVQSGIPERLRGTLKGAEVELVGGADQQALLAYVGRRTISKRGCAGCHDIPGFESAKPIGTTLADWGRKETSKLAFEHIVHYREHQHAEREKEHATTSGNGSHGKTKHGHGLDPATLDADEGYYVASLMHHQREGFLRQKLEEPRSYDYKKIENKSYNDRLRMPQFPWAAGVVDSDQRAERKHQEIEAIMTFVLGLVAEPPAAQYIYKPDARREAIVQGEKVVQKFNCAGCHTLELGRWDISYRPGEAGFEATDPPNVFPFLMPEFTTAEVYASKHVDWQGLLHGTVRGLQRVDKDGNREQLVWDPEEEDYLPLEEYIENYEADPPEDAVAYSVDLWKPTYLDGHPYHVTDPIPPISRSMVRNYYPPRGGEFARLLLPIAVDLVRKTEPTADGNAAMAWVPPPLVGQGKKTQEEWLTEFLLQPYRIRPGVLLRMPKFNMSRAESSQLAQYFAARDNQNYPVRFEARRDLADLAEAESGYQERLLAMGASGTRFGDALKIVINKAGCVSCHSVNDLKPEGGARSNGPNLGDVYRRLQPSYMKRWIAQPSWILPYTKMQVVIPYRRDDPPIHGGYLLNALDSEGEPKLDADGKPILIELYHGNSTGQLQAVVDLLSNFGLYTESQTSIHARAEELNKELDSSP